MIETIDFPGGGRITGRCLKDQSLCGGRNGIAICRAIMVTDLVDYLVLRPVTSRDVAQANTFIDIPADPELLEKIGQVFTSVASRRRRQREKEYRASFDARNAKSKGTIA